MDERKPLARVPYAQQWAVKSDAEIARDMLEGVKFFGMPAPKIALDIIAQHGDTFDKQVINDVINERNQQDAQWGGPSADDSREVLDFCRYIERQIYKIDHSEGEADCLEHFRSRYVKIAALAVAACESIDRRMTTFDKGGVNNG